jgi:hypothetical protein
MGHAHVTTKRGGSTRGRRLGRRKCLRNGCGRKFQARRRKDQFCGEPDCQRELACWRAAKRRRQAAQRQRKCRAKPERREKHAEGQRQRRAKARQQLEEKPAVTTAASEPCAWSRTTRLPEIFCDRPGCYEPPRDGPHARYCGQACASAMRQAQDRERKCLRRKSKAGQSRRRKKDHEVRAKRRQGHPAAKRSAASLLRVHRPPDAILVLERNADPAVDSRGPQEKNHDPKASLAPRPRAPPAP